MCLSYGVSTRSERYDSKLGSLDELISELNVNLPRTFDQHFMLHVLAGFVNSLLSWKGFIPLSRLSYCAYLVHPAVIYYSLLSQRQPIYMTDANMVGGTVGYPR